MENKITADEAKKLQKRLKDIEEFELSPEILWRDGEASPAEVRSATNRLMSERAKIKRLLDVFARRSQIEDDRQSHIDRTGNPPPAADVEEEERQMQELEAKADREETARDEANKQKARDAMEQKPGLATIMDPNRKPAAKRTLTVFKNGSLRRVRGNTYDARPIFKANKFRWNGFEKAWETYLSDDKFQLVVGQLQQAGFEVGYFQPGV